MFKHKIRFDRHEIAGSFGDISTDLPLIVGMIQAVNLNSASIYCRRVGFESRLSPLP